MDSSTPNSRVTANTRTPVVRTGGATAAGAGVFSVIRESRGTDRCSCASPALSRALTDRTVFKAWSADAASADTVISGVAGWLLIR
jgi:hypothetical protein